MNKSIVQCLESDYKLAIQQIFARMFPSAERWDDSDLPLLKMEYLVEDHNEVYNIHTN